MRPGTTDFDGARLREAREARGLTAISLADLIGVSRQAVSQYENGPQTPGSDAMRRITEVLNLPHSFFISKRVNENLGTVFYRSMSAATKAARVRAERRYIWLRDIVQFLQNHVALPDVNVPQFEIPVDPVLISEDLIESTARQLRRAWNLGDGPISNVVWLLENNGIVVARQEFGVETLDAFSEWSRMNIRPFMVLGADKDSAARSRFDAAHELGHLVLHRNVPQEMLEKNFKLIEKQAHLFSGAFNLPRETFGNDVRSLTLDFFITLKSRWKISIAAMVQRCKHLRLCTEDQAQRMFMNLSRRGWRKREPLDDELEPEQPRLLKRCFDVLLENKLVTGEDLESAVALPGQDIEDLLGLPSGYLRRDRRELKILRLPSFPQARDQAPNFGNQPFKKSEGINRITDE